VTKGRAGIGVIICSRCGDRAADITRFQSVDRCLVCRDVDACRRRTDEKEGS
jgi:hypothetical protein